MSEDKGTLVTSVDLDTGEKEEIIKDNFCVVVDGDCEISHMQAYSTGTVQITIKRPRG